MTTQYFVSNQAPRDLDPLTIDPPLATDPNDPDKEYNIATALETPINDTWFTPMNAGQPVTVNRVKGTHTEALDPARVAELIAEVANPDEDTNTTDASDNADVLSLIHI